MTWPTTRGGQEAADAVIAVRRPLLQVAALTDPERQANPAQRGLQRIKKLEQQLEKLIDAVDERLRQPPVAPPRPVWPDKPASLTPLQRPWVLAGGAALLFIAGCGVSTLVYETRLRAQVDTAWEFYEGELDSLVTTVDNGLATRMDEARELEATVDRLNQDLRQQSEAITEQLAAARAELAELGASAAQRIEERLAEPTDALGGTIAALQARATAT